MARETTDEKALRMIRERRVELVLVDASRDEWPVRARVRGEEGEYRVGFDAGRWRCECEASAKFRRRCSHIRAVALVVLPPS